MVSTASALQLQNILYEKKGPIAYVTLNRPKVLNALSQAVFSELKEVFGDARDDASVRGVILTGSGDKAFAAGADIAEMSTSTGVQAEESTRHAQAVTELIENLGKPVIAAVNGFALGGGCELAMACTIRIASENCEVWSARSQARNHARRRRNAASSAIDRQRQGAATDPHRRNHQCSGGLSHRPGQ